MKTSVFLKEKKNESKQGISCIGFRVRDKEIDIKVISELEVVTKYWDVDALRYRRNTSVPKNEQKHIPEMIATIIEHADHTFDRNKADSDWLRLVIEDVLHPMRAFERNHPSLLTRMSEYISQHGGTRQTKAQIENVLRKLTRYIAYNREILGKSDFNLFVENISLEDLNDFRDYIAAESQLYLEHLDFYSQYIPSQYRPRAKSNTTIINTMNQLCVFLHWCKRMGYTQNESFLQYGCKVPVYGDPFYLTKEERNVLYDADLSDVPQLAVIRDIFVFHCYIGCRVGDLYKLTEENIKDGFVEYMPQKTKKCEAKIVRVPLHDKARRIIARYKDADTGGKLFPFKQIAVYNNGIRELLKYCGIDRMVTILDTHGYKTVQKPLYEVASSHTARKTFVGNLYKQVPDPNLIASMSGHVEGSRAFARYRNIDDDMKRKLVDMIN